MIKNTCFQLLLACFVLCLFTTSSFADVSKKQCVADATKAKDDSIAEARTIFSSAVTACKGPCYEACRSAFNSCVAPLRATREECVSSAELVFSNSVASCKTSTECGNNSACYANKAFQTCLVDPRVLRRVSIRSCNLTAAAGIKSAQCERVRNACNKTCRAQTGS
jgi:hypothetical protein